MSSVRRARRAEACQAEMLEPYLVICLNRWLIGFLGPAMAYRCSVSHYSQFYKNVNVMPSLRDYLRERRVYSVTGTLSL